MDHIASDKLLKQVRNRKQRITRYSVTIACSLISSILLFGFSLKMINQYGNLPIEDMKSTVLIYDSWCLAYTSIFATIFLVVVLGAAVLLILEIKSSSKDHVLAEICERLDLLENQQKITPNQGLQSTR